LPAYTCTLKLWHYRVPVQTNMLVILIVRPKGTLAASHDAAGESR